jgi:DNA-binding SARP family transcriptional activator
VTILGTVRIVVDDRPLIVPRARARGLLALLALHHGQTCTTDALIEAMWAGSPPEKARGQVHSAMSAIRAVLSAAGCLKALDSDRFGYRLTVSPSCVDFADFRRLVHAAKEQRDDVQAVWLWREALALFQGEPLADAAGAYVSATRSGIDEGRLAAVEDLADILLRLGQHADVASELLPLLAAHPHRERLRGRVMLALHGSGRQAEALALYHSYRRELAEREGLNPGVELAELAVDILRAGHAGPRLATRPRPPAEGQ